MYDLDARFGSVSIESFRIEEKSFVLFFVFLFFVADGINSVGGYNSPPGGCRLYVCVPTFFHVLRWDNF